MPHHLCCSSLRLDLLSSLPRGSLGGPRELASRVPSKVSLESLRSQLLRGRVPLALCGTGTPRGTPVRASVSTAVEVESQDEESRSDMEVEFLIHYSREGGDYEGWGLHVWGDALDATEWSAPLQVEAQWRDNEAMEGEQSFGVQWVVRALASRNEQGVLTTTVHVLPHKWEEKDCSWTLEWKGEADGVQQRTQSSAWLVSGLGSRIFSERPDPSSIPKGSLDTARAMWLARDLIAVNWDELLSKLEIKGEGQPLLQLSSSPTAQLQLSSSGVDGADTSVSLTVDPNGLPQAIRDKFPHIAHFTALRLAPDTPVQHLVKCQLALSCKTGGRVHDVTEVQVTGVLDDCFFYQGPLGVHVSPGAQDGVPQVSMNLWAPTAQSVSLLLFNEPHRTGPVLSLPMLQSAQGTWSAQGNASDWLGLYYQYELLVYHPQTRQLEKSIATDPYSRGLSANGERTLIMDLNSEAACNILLSKGHSLEPSQWDQLHLEKPTLESFSDISLYELHIRDFSAMDGTVPSHLRGTYQGFTQKESNGVKHLNALSEAGLTHVHLLPSYDFASVNEDKSTWKFVDEAALQVMPSDSEGQQAAVAAIQDEDAFNWGYDPVHWGVPDGSYATNPDGPTRTLEHRAMVQALNRMGLRVVLDVVYNHLHASGPHDSHSVLDKVVPGYYLRRGLDGSVEGSTCCNNTASEHAMVERLIVDDIIMWATHYKVDGFRFDLMGHLMKKTLLKARDALNALTIEEHGVDGPSIFMYGEGWDFGEVRQNGRGENGSQANLANTTIGTFNDRFRDAMLGGSPFGDIQQQGFLTGLFLQPNKWEIEQAAMRTKGQEESEERSGVEREWMEQLQRQCDWIQLGLIGNLKDYSFMSHALGTNLKGGDVKTMDGTSVAYAGLPFETINYVSAHDNETLFDIVNIKAAEAVSGPDRRKTCQLALGMLALSQGIPFFHAGDEMFRSKSLDRDSYNSGDWFNKLDFSYATNNFGVGLPMKGKNGEKWDLMRPLLRNESLHPEAAEIAASVENFKLMLRIRYSSPLFRLQSPQDIIERVSFFSQSAAEDSVVPPGVIVMKLIDGNDVSGLKELDPCFKSIVVIMSVRPDSSRVYIPELASMCLSLHPLLESQSGNAHPQIQAGDCTMPPRSMVVFVEKKE